MAEGLHALQTKLAQLAWRAGTGDGAISTLPAPLDLDDLEGGAQLMEAAGALAPAVRFRWTGPDISRPEEAGLLLVHGAAGAAFVLYERGAEGPVCIARLQVERAFTAFFHTFAGENGAGYGIVPFSSLPTLTTNHRPALLAEATVAAAYRAFLDGPAIPLLHDPWRQLQRRLKRIQRPSGIQLGMAHGGRQRDREEALTAREKERLLEQYLALTYKELASAQ